MIHRFISNDNKGNVNTFEIGSTYTKISKITTPVNDEDAANKKYVDDHVGSGGGVLIVTQSGDLLTGYSLDKTWQEIYDAGLAVLKLEGVGILTMIYCQADVDGTDGNTTYIVSFGAGGNFVYGTTDPDDYPVKFSSEGEGEGEGGTVVK